MNIQMQLAGFGVLLFLLCFYIRRKTVGLYTEVFFKWTMVITLINVTLDVLSIIIIANRNQVPNELCFIICKTYLISLIWTGCCGLFYICQDIYRGRARFRSLFGFGTVSVIGSFVVLFLPISYVHQKEEIYTYGPSVFATYLFCVFFVFATLLFAFIYRRYMNKNRFSAVVMWILVWMLAALVQFFNNHLLLVGYASCLGMMIVFFKLENPEAYIDKETGAFNSHVFLKYIRQLYEKATSFSVLLISLEQHQNILDRYRDANLLSIFNFLNNRENVKVFKNVEQEFVMLFEEPEQLENEFGQIRSRFKNDWHGFIYDPIFVTIQNSNIADSAEEIYQLLRYYRLHIEHMDDRRRIEIDKSLVEERRQQQKMEDIICEALAEDRVEVFLQPIYSVETQRFVSAEALARIRLPDGSLVPPGQFIAVAETTGLILQLGERIFEKTCQFIQREKIWEWGLTYVEINLSIKQCESRDLAERYIQIMENYHLNPSLINLEVTESVSIQMRNILLQNMKRLINYGVSFSLDDFGNGESNLNYIVDLPVQIIKFDREMVQSYFEKDKGRFVMEAATRMILDMNLKIVAEGVETDEQLVGMQLLGVQYIQGYLFSKPLPEREFVEFVKESVNIY